MIEIVKCRRCGKLSDADTGDLGTYFCHCEHNKPANMLIIQEIANQITKRFYESRQKTPAAIHVDANKHANKAGLS